MKTDQKTTGNERLWWETHAPLLGKLTGNLLSIEFLARLMIAMQEVGGDIKKTRPLVTQIQEGEWVELTPLSNKEDLRWVLDRYNKCVKHERRELTVDTNKIVFLRDALAHGRQFGIQSTPHLVLIKFNRKSKDRKVQVDLRVDMTKEWLNEQVAMLIEAISKVTKALGFSERQIGRFSDS